MNIIVAALMALSLSHARAGDPKDFTYQGEYVEGCSCMGVCQCELTGVQMGCQGVALFHATKASYGGDDIGEFKAAYAVEPGKWVIIYIDAPADKAAAAANMMKASLAAFGPIEAVRNCTIAYMGNMGENKVTVDGNTIMTLTTEPVMGGDGKGPMVYNNIHDPIHPTIMQGKTDACMYKDGGHSFTLKGSNAYFNDHLDSNGKI